MKGLQVSLNQTQRVRLQSALQKLEDIASKTTAAVTVADTIPVNNEDGILKGHGTMEFKTVELSTLEPRSDVVATLCGVVERVNKLVYVRSHRARYKPEVGDIIVGRVIEIVPKRWKLEINFSQDAVLMLSSMNLPDGIQRRRTAVDELNMRSIFEENDVVCAEVRGLQHDGSLHLQARSQKYGKLEKGQMLTVPAYLVKRRKHHFHHLEQYGVVLILGCNGYIWVGEHVQTRENDDMVEDHNNRPEETQDRSLSLETRQYVCRIANAVRLLASLGFVISVEVILDAVEASISSNVDIKDMLGAEFYVQMAEKEVQRRLLQLKRRG